MTYPVFCGKAELSQRFQQSEKMGNKSEFRSNFWMNFRWEQGIMKAE